MSTICLGFPGFCGCTALLGGHKYKCVFLTQPLSALGLFLSMLCDIEGSIRAVGVMLGILIELVVESNPCTITLALVFYFIIFFSSAVPGFKPRILHVQAYILLPTYTDSPDVSPFFFFFPFTFILDCDLPSCF